MRWLPALLLVIGAGCGGQDRQGLTADSAVMPPVSSGSGGADSTSASAPDSAARDPLGGDSLALPNPTIVLIADSVAGDVLFRRKGKCLSCHGLSGKGIDALGPNLQDSVWLHGDGSFAFIQRTIMHGIARPIVSQMGMPSFARAQDADPSTFSNTLSSEEIYHITAYVYALSHPGSAVADTASAIPDTARVRSDSVPPTIPPPVPLARGSVLPQSDIPTQR